MLAWYVDPTENKEWTGGEPSVSCPNNVKLCHLSKTELTFHTMHRCTVYRTDSP